MIVLNKSKFKSILAKLILMFVLVSNSVFADSLLSNEKLQGLGINSAEVKTQLSTRFGMTATYNGYASFYKRFIILTSDTLYVVTGDDRGIEMTLPLSNVQSVAIESTGLFRNGRDIELRVDMAVVILSFGGEIIKAEKLFADIAASGVKVTKFIGERARSLDGKAFINVM